MAARFVYWMNVSLDLFIERTTGEDGGGPWLRIGEDLHREFNARAAALTAMVQGRVVYEIMEGFWPAARDDTTLPDYLREYGEIWTSKPKVLVSTTRTLAKYHTEILADDVLGRLAALRARTEGAIGVGGATLASTLLAGGLLDELLLFTHPVILGAGRPLFDARDEPVDLDLLESAPCAGGVDLHRYEVRR